MEKEVVAKEWLVCGEGRSSYIDRRQVECRRLGERREDSRKGGQRVSKERAGVSGNDANIAARHLLVKPQADLRPAPMTRSLCHKTGGIPSRSRLTSSLEAGW